MICEHKIAIEANKDEVWQATVNIESWPKWWPTIQKVTREDPGEFNLGSSARIKQRMMPETRWVVTEWNPDRGFTWTTKTMGIEMVASHEILPEGSWVSSTLRIELKGMLVSLFGPVLKVLIDKSLQDENLSLKRYCESKVE